MDNRQIAKLFQRAAHLLEFHGENIFKIRSYENAADTINSLPDKLENFNEQALEQLEGIGKNLSKKIIQIRQTGSFDELDRLVPITPKGLLELIGIKGLSPKKLAQLWKELNIQNADDLLKACKNGEVASVKGFGDKTQENIIEVLLFFFENKGKFLYRDAEQEAFAILDKLKASDLIIRAELCGAIRRKEIIISSLSFLICLHGNIEEVENYYLNIGLTKDENNTWYSPSYQIPVIIYYCEEQNFIGTWIEETGVPAHNKYLDKSYYLNAKTEEDVYDLSGLPYIIPEMREGLDEFEIMENISEEDIISYQDLKGCLHNHSIYSDGNNTIEEMALRCKTLGLEYFGISDHSQTAVYANGLKPETVLKQIAEIDQLNLKLAPFKIFKGIESDILSDGSLDYEEEILKCFDYIVASIHSGLKMTEANATKRLIKAIENPYTTILGHMTGRLLLMRQGYPINHEKVIDACAANGVCIEINANPRRLDISWEHIRYAVDKGVMLSINPDAHALKEIEYMNFGVCAARKAGLVKDMVLNTMNSSRLSKIFEHKKINA